MKNKFLIYFGFALLAMLSIQSCTEDLVESPDTLVDKDGPAEIHYIRVTDPESSDSLLTSAYLGSLIAIIGDNLGDTKELWFNDQKALLNPAYISDKSILVSVPTSVPEVVTDEIKLVDSQGTEYLYPFVIDVPGPRMTGIKCEYVPDGGTVVISGDYFFEPTEVIFPGGVSANIISLSKTELSIEVPEGSSSGQIQVSTNFGSAKSSFLFRDDRNILLNYDDLLHETWTSRIGYDDVPGIEPVSGNFSYFQSESHGAWQWVNEMTMQYWAPRGRGNIPVAEGLIEDLVFKMEVNVPVEWKDVRMEIFFAPYAEDHGRDVVGTSMARWEPWKQGPYTTDGWITLAIPLSEFAYHKDDNDGFPTLGIEDLSILANVTMMVFGPAETSNPVLIAFDNLRIVPK